MKQALLLMTAVVLASSVAGANSLCVNDGSLASYISGSSTFGTACQIGDKLFWGFALTAGPNAIGAEPTASQIQVQTLPGDGLSNIGIAFNSGGWVISSGIPIDSIISYNVATVSGDAIIEDATLTITGQLTGVGGSGNVVETLTPPIPGSPLIASLPSSLVVNINFSGTMQSTFAVQDEINLVGGTGFSDLAHISAIENDFSEFVSAPEPLTTVLIGLGLLGLGIARRKKNSR